MLSGVKCEDKACLMQQPSSVKSKQLTSDLENNIN